MSAGFSLRLSSSVLIVVDTPAQTRLQGQRRRLGQSGVLQSEGNQQCVQELQQAAMPSAWATASRMRTSGVLAAYRSHKDSTCLEVVEDE